MIERKVCVAGEVVTPSSSVKYLGIHIDQALSFEEQVSSVITKCFATSHFAVKLLRLTGCSTVIKDFIDACILSVLLYGLPAYVSLLGQTQSVRFKSILYRLSYLSARDRTDLKHWFVGTVNKMSQSVFSHVREPAHPLHHILETWLSLGYSDVVTRNRAMPRVRTALAQKSLLYTLHVNPDHCFLSILR